MLCISCLLLSKLTVHEMDCLKEETVLMPGRTGAQCSVAPTRQQQFEKEVG